MNIKSAVESILFISNKPLTVSELAKLVNVDKRGVEQEVAQLALEYNQKGRGVNLVRNNKEVQLVTSGDNRKFVEEFIKNELTGEMTRPQLETLTIIAYRGPIAKEELEQIRGVNCSIILRNLMIRGLVAREEDKKLMRNLYQVTLEFIKYLGITDIKKLPDYDKLSRSDVLDKLFGSSQEQAGVSQPVIKKLDL